LIERFFARLKQFRRIATRYDKLAKSFLSFILKNSVDHVLFAESLAVQWFQPFHSNCSAIDSNSPQPLLNKAFSLPGGFNCGF
jgi:hypothetical protein